MIMKEIPEDFCVKEISKLEFNEKGRYYYYLLKKRNYNTLDAIKRISEKLRIDMMRIGYAGNKDKFAITEQYISIKDYKINNLNLKDIELTFVGNGSKPILLGDLEKNSFRITVRGLDKKKNGKVKWIINYFDEQRFGGDNIETGKKILKNEFNDLDKPKTLLMLYVHSVQSYIWNKTVEKYLIEKNGTKIKYNHGYFLFPERKIKNEKIPLVGYLTVIKNKKIDDIIYKLMDKEKIKISDFLIQKLPRISQKGGERELIAKVSNFKIKYFSDDLHKNKYKAIFDFVLPKGVYATLVIKRFFK